MLTDAATPTIIRLSDEAFDAFAAELDAPAKVIPELAAAIEASPWAARLLRELNDESFIDQYNAARAVYAASPQDRSDWCQYDATTKALRLRFGR